MGDGILVRVIENSPVIDCIQQILLTVKAECIITCTESLKTVFSSVMLVLDTESEQIDTFAPSQFIRNCKSFDIFQVTVRKQLSTE